MPDTEDIENSKEKEMLDLAKKRLRSAMDADNHNRVAAVEDLRFLRGEQWDNGEKQRRKDSGRPCLQINVLPKYSKQVCGEMRRNKSQIKIRAVDSKADVQISKIREGIIYNIEYLSDAESIYDYAGKMLVDCGYGAWRILTRYTEENPFVQEIYLERIKNPFSVFFDPKAKNQNFADAEWAFIITKMSREDFEDEFGKDMLPGGDIVENPQTGTRDEYWWDRDTVTVAEYFYMYKKEKTICLLSDDQILEKKEAEEYIEKARNSFDQASKDHPEMANRDGNIPTIVEECDIKEPHLKWKKITATKILEERDLAGKYIPIVLITGEETNIEGKQYINGLIRNAKDPQRMLNFWHCLSLDTPLPTPEGWTTMGEVKKGDRLFDDKGKICEVLGVSPIHKNYDCFEITFEDGSKIVADKDHLWNIERDITKRERGTKQWELQTRKTGELISRKDYIYVSDPLNLPEANLSIDPYVLGVWLGDGSQEWIKITEGSDTEEIYNNLKLIGLSLGEKCEDKRHRGVFTFPVYDVRNKFSELNLIKNKHIPLQYLRGSYLQRLSLLQGLMDTDGSVSSNFICSFTTVNKELSDGFAELLSSLGIKFGVLYRKGRFVKFPTYSSQGKSQYQLSFTAPDIPIFRLQRKLEKQFVKKEWNRRRVKRHRIMSVTSVSSVPVKCVKVSSKSSLFLAGKGMIPTHNTSACETIALAPKAPWQATAKQIEGYENDYLSANENNFPVLLYNVDKDAAAPAPMRIPTAQPPVAIFSEIGRAEQNIKDTIGMYNSDVGDTSNEHLRDVSGAAITARQMPGDTATFVYPDNLAKGIAYGGKIINDLIPYIYDTERDVRLRNIDGTETFVPINTTVGKAVENINENPQRFSGMNKNKLLSSLKERGPNEKFNDITVGKYDVVITTGPTFATQRAEAVENMVKIAMASRMSPIDKYFILKNSDFPGADEYAEVVRRMIPPNLLPPKEGDVPVPPLPPPPQVMVVQAKVQLNMAKMQTEKIKLQKALVELQKEMKDSDAGVKKQILDLLSELNAPVHPADNVNLSNGGV